MADAYPVLGDCPVIVASFDITLAIPQMVESPTAQNLESEFKSSPPVFISRGLWNVSFIRTELPWDGTPHVWPIYSQAFACGVTQDTSIEAGEPWVYRRVSWPCNLVSDVHFTEDLNVLPPGVEALPGNGTLCRLNFQFDAGCPNCADLIAVTLGVIAGIEHANANAYGFTVRAIGVRIG